MLKKRSRLLTFLLFITCVITANYLLKPRFSRNIDLSKLNAKEKAYLAPYKDKIIHNGFNQAPEIGEVIQAIADEFSITQAVETGTFMGETTNFLSACFDTVHTIEIVEKNLDQAKKTLSAKQNIYFHHGSSQNVLADLLPEISQKPALFYLDAHWNEYWPLLDELELISKTHKNNCVIVIDDFKVPHRKDIQFDQYGPHQCSYKYIQSMLEKVFTHYDYFYLIPKNVGSRAKFVAFPKTWSRKKSYPFNPKLELTKWKKSHLKKSM